MSRYTRRAMTSKDVSPEGLTALLKKFTYDRFFQIKRDYNNLQDSLENISKFGITRSDLHFLLNSDETPEEIKDVASHPSIEAAAKLKSEQDTGNFQLIKTAVRHASDIEESQPASRPIKRIHIEKVRECLFGDIIPRLNGKVSVDYPPPLPRVNDDNILKVVFTHSSAANDPTFDVHESNERLEFLGDSVLNHVISVLLFAKFPDLSEGYLTNLRSEIVCNKNLTRWSALYGFDKQLISNLSTESIEKGNKKVYADIFEAYVGGLYQDSRGDINEILPWLNTLSEPIISKIQQSPVLISSSSNSSQTETKQNYQTPNDNNSKTSKQELYVLLNPIFVPQYEVVKKEKSDHNPLFTVACVVHGEVLGVAESRSIKLSGQMAAFDALNNNKDKVEEYRDLGIKVKDNGSLMPPKIETPIEQQAIAHCSKFGL